MDSSVDKSALETLLGDVGDSAFLRLAEIFTAECENNCAEITRFIFENNLSSTEIVAHRFKSTARQFGAYGLAETCRELENACANGDSEQVLALSRSLTENLPQVHSNLSETALSITKSG